MSETRTICRQSKWTAVGMLALCALGGTISQGAVIGFQDGTGFTQTARDGTGSTGNATLIRDGVLTLTNAVNGQTRSAFFSTPQPTSNWTASFTYRFISGTGADGFAFVVQGQAPTAIGAGGGALGYGSSSTMPGVRPSVAVVVRRYAARGQPG